MLSEKKFYEKYLKYKKKYLELKEQQGGAAMTYRSKESGTPKIYGICGFLINMQDERVFLIYLPFPNALYKISSNERKGQIDLLEPEIKSLSKSDFNNSFKIFNLFDGYKYLQNILEEKFKNADRKQIEIYRDRVLSSSKEMDTKGKTIKYGVYAYLIKNEDDEQFIIYVTIDKDKKSLNGPSKLIGTRSVTVDYTAYVTENSIIFVRNENKFDGNKELVKKLKEYALHND